MARIDISRELEAIAEAKRRKEHEALERRRLLFEQARAAVSDRIAKIEDTVMKGDANEWLELNSWRLMGKGDRSSAWWANLEILHTERAFTCTMKDAVQITAAVYIMRHAGGTPAEMFKLGFTIPDVSTGY
jgi:hypothetical protein